MAFYGPKETWKVVYVPKDYSKFVGGQRGVALVEACDHHDAMYTFQRQYAGQFITVESCKKLIS